jgi:hypothetical protein
MRKERLDAIASVTPLFRQAELSTDAAAADAAACIAEMLRVRSANRLPIGTASDMIRMLTDALSAQVKARELFIEAHRLTPDVLGSLGIRAYGDEHPCPPTEGFADRPAAIPLKVVA